MKFSWVVIVLCHIALGGALEIGHLVYFMQGKAREAALPPISPCGSCPTFHPQGSIILFEEFFFGNIDRS